MGVIISDALPGSSILAQPLNHARIGYHNRGRLASWLASSFEDDFEPSALNNEMTLRRWRGQESAMALVLDGASGNYASSPDAAILDITGDIEFRAHIKPEHWTPAGIQRIISKSTASGDQRSYRFILLTTGRLAIAWSTTGAAAGVITATSTVAVAGVNGEALWVRGTLDIDNGSSQHVVKFYTSTDGINWTQLGATVTTSGGTSIFAGTSILEVGSGDVGVSERFDGTIFRTIIYDGHADNHVGLHANFPGAVTDYVSTPDALILDATGDMEVIVHFRPDDYTPASTFYIIGKHESTGNQGGWFMSLIASTGFLYFGTTPDGTNANIVNNQSNVALFTGAGITNGDPIWIRVVYDVNDGSGNRTCKFYWSNNGSSWTQLGTTITTAVPTSIFSNTSTLNIGTSDTGNQTVNGQIYRALVYANNLVLNGASGAYASIPDEAALDIVGDIDIRALIAASDWTPALTSTIVGKWVGSGNQRSYELLLNAAGSLDYAWTEDGSTIKFTNSVSVVPGVTAGKPMWVRVTHDVNNGAGGNDVKFYYSTDGTTWTQLGSTQTTAGVTSIFSSSAPLQIGAINLGTFQIFIGKVYQAQVYNGIAGSLVANIDFQRATVGNTTFPAATGQTVTLNGAAAIEQTLRADFNPDLDSEQADTSFASSSTGETYTVFGNALITDGRIADFNPELDAPAFNSGDDFVISSATKETYTINNGAIIDEVDNTIGLWIRADMGSFVEFDYIGLAAHNLEGHVINLQYSDDALTWETIETFTPEDNEAVMVLFEPVTARHVRLLIAGSADPEIGLFYIGNVLAMQRPIYGGHSPIQLSRNTVTIPRQSESGQFLSLNRIRRGYSGGASWRHLEAGWYRENFDPFVEEATTRPFFLAWNPLRHPEECVYGWCDQDISPSNMGVRNFMEVGISMQCFRE